MIHGKNLASFPSATFNKAHDIGGKNGIISGMEGLKDMFSTLGFTVATADQQRVQWGKIL